MDGYKKVWCINQSTNQFISANHPGQGIIYLGQNRPIRKQVYNSIKSQQLHNYAKLFYTRKEQLSR